MKSWYFLITIFVLSQPRFVFAGEKSLGPASLAYDSLYTQFMDLSPDEMKVANVQNMTIQRDVGSFILYEGLICLCRPVANRLCAAVFRGKGIFMMKPPTEVERQQTYRFFEKDSMKEEFSQLFLLFADTTAEELSRLLTFGTRKRKDLSDAEDFVKSVLDYVGNKDIRYFDSDFMYAFLQREHNDLFYAHFAEKKSRPLYFMVNPYEEEEVSFGQRDPKAWGHNRETINQFHTHQEYVRGADIERRVIDKISISDYVIDATIKTNLDFSAMAKMKFKALKGDQQWITLQLYSELELDSLFWKPGVRADFHRGKDQWEIWILCRPRLVEGQVCSLQAFYHGELLKKDELSWITIQTSIGWYPQHSYKQHANFDLTFHTPAYLKFACVGENVSSKEEDRVLSSRWIPRRAMRNASFNIGFFKEFEIKDERVPPVTVYIAEYGHTQIGTSLIQKGVVSGRNMDEQVGTDIANSINFFQSVFGKSVVDRFYATEIPGYHGEAFPGLVHLSWMTYQLTDETGFNEFFRAHEVAHQWWAIGVDYATYHDQWLSEGFASYSGIWYMQMVLQNNKKFFNMLDKWKTEILKNRHYLFGTGQEAGPIWLGYRTNSSATPGDYDLIIYKKGAWVIHMLRNMLLDLKTMNEDRFTNLMRDFYTTYAGKEATTKDFERIVSKHMGEDMQWFFNQWVYDTRVPEYKFSYRTTKTSEGKYRVTCRVRQENVQESFKMYVPILIKFGGDRFARWRVEVTGRQKEFDLPLLPIAPEEIVFNDLNSVLCEVDDVSWE